MQSKPPYPESGHGFSEWSSRTALASQYDSSFRPPSLSIHSGRSPLKMARQVSTSPPKPKFGKNINSVSFPPPQSSIYTDSPLKRELPTNASILPQVFHNPSYVNFSSGSSVEKENIAPVYHSDNLAEFPDPASAYKMPFKRTSSFATSLEMPSPKKKKRNDDPPAHDLPEPESMPFVSDDGKKPPYSYAVLIGMAILRSPDRRLTLAQIYKWISSTFAHYKNKAEPGWQNSIRHNLSLNKAFYKQERPKDDPGKGNYWAIEPGKENMFINKDKSSMRRPASSSGQSTKSSSHSLSSESCTWNSQRLPLARPLTHVSEAAEPTSDATVIASDAPSPFDEQEEQSAGMPPPPIDEPPAPSPVIFKSSPPVDPPSRLRESTPSPSLDLEFDCSVDRSGFGGRRLPGVDDSGYFSSLDSSATKSHADPALPSVDQGKSRIRHGRAEEEIVRIRSSSHDISPSKCRSFKQSTPALVSSSPLQHLDTSLMLPPLTPALKLRLPPKPPPSISPNTNLRNHRNKIRELVGSPMKNVGPSETLAFSPAFKIVDEEGLLFNQDSSPGFTIFTDENDDLFQRSITCSPEKRSDHQASMELVSKSSTVLADVTGTSTNSNTPCSTLRVPHLESPLKQRSGNESPLRFGSTFSDASTEDLFGLKPFDDDEPVDLSGVDILQGFQKIGGKKSISKRPTRPLLGHRSRTSKF